MFTCEAGEDNFWRCAGGTLRKVIGTPNKAGGHFNIF